MSQRREKSNSREEGEQQQQQHSEFFREIFIYKKRVKSKNKKKRKKKKKEEMEEDERKKEPDTFYVYDNIITDIHKKTIITSDVFVDAEDDNDEDDTNIDLEGSSSNGNNSNNDPKEEHTYKHRSYYRNELITNISYEEKEEKSGEEEEEGGKENESLEEILNSISSLSSPDDGKLYPKNIINNKNMDMYTKWRHNLATSGTQSPSVRERSTSVMQSFLSSGGQLKTGTSKTTTTTTTEEGVSNELDQAFKSIVSQKKDDEEKSNFEMFVSELSTIDSEEDTRNDKGSVPEREGKTPSNSPQDQEIPIPVNNPQLSKLKERKPLTMSARYPKLRKTLQSLIDDEDVDSDDVDESLFLSRRSARVPFTKPISSEPTKGSNLECVEISSVPVPIFLSPLGDIQTKVRAAVDREEMIGSELATSSSRGSTLSGSSSTGNNVHKIEFVTFYNSRAIDSTEFVKRENIKRNNRNELVRYKKLVETSLDRCKEDKSEMSTQKTELLEKIREKLKEFSGWHRPAFLAHYRRAAQLQMSALNIQSKIIDIKMPFLERKLEQVDRLIEAANEDRFFIIKPPFYVNPNDNFSKEQEKLVNLEQYMERTVKRIMNRLKKLAVEYEQEILPEERERRITSILDRIELPPEEVFFPLDDDLQSEFDTWIKDTRTKEGSTIDKFCNDLSAGISTDKSSVGLEFIELFIGELAHDIIYDYDGISDSPEDRNDRKLALLIQRTLFPMVYQSAILLSPAPLQENSIRFLEKVGRLREENHPQIAIDSALTLGGINPFADACRILSNLPYELIPIEMINIVQKTITRISQLGSTLLAHDLGADEIVPFLVYVIVNTDLPGVHETIYMMSAVSDSNYGEFGWCVATFETAISFIEGIHDPEKEDKTISER